MEHEQKWIMTWGCDSMCHGEIWKFQSPSLPVWNVLCITSVNMSRRGCKIWSSSANLLLWFLGFHACSGWLKLFHQQSNRSIQWSLAVVVSLTLRCELFPASVSPMSYSHILMDCKEPDDKWYIWCHGCLSSQFSSVNRIATKAHVSNHSKQ